MNVRVYIEHDIGVGTMATVTEGWGDIRRLTTTGAQRDKKVHIKTVGTDVTKFFQSFGLCWVMMRSLRRPVFVDVESMIVAGMTRFRCSWCGRLLPTRLELGKSGISED